MANLKKGIAVMLAAATALTFAPVSTLGRPTVEAEAAEYSETGIDVNTRDREVSASRQYKATADNAGTYRLTVDKADGWRALAVTGIVTGTTTTNRALNASDNTITLNAGDTFVPTFRDNQKGLNGTYTFTLTYIGNGTNVTSQDKVSYTVNLSNSVLAGVTGASLGTIKDASGAVVSPSLDQMGSNATYSLNNGSTYDVTFTAPKYQPTAGSADQLNSTNTTLDLAFDGSSVNYTPVAASGSAVAAAVKLTAVQPGKTSVTARWTARNDIGTDIKSGDTISDYTFTVDVPDTSHDAQVAYQSGGKQVTATTGTNAPIALDTIVNRTEQISVTNASATPIFISDKPSVATVSQDGTVTAAGYGSANIIVYVGDKHYTITVNVSDVGTDRITAKAAGVDVDDSNNGINLDLAASTAPNAVKSTKLEYMSQNGLVTTAALYTSENASAPVSGNSTAIATLAADGTITAGSQAGTVYVKLTSATDATRKINGTEKWVKVTVNAKPQAQITVNTPEIKLDVKTKTTADLTSLVTSNVANVSPLFSMTASDSTENKNVASISGKTLKAAQIGVGTLLITLPETNTTRQTTATVKVNVVSEIAKKDSDLTVPETYIGLKMGSNEQGTVTATTTVPGSVITYTSSDPAVVTVDSQSGQLTAVGEGHAVITVTASETADYNPGTKTVTVVVEKADEPAPVKPKKVQNVKVTGRKKNSKKVTVTWDAQEGEGIYYQVAKRSVTTKKVKGKNKTTYSKWYSQYVYSGNSAKLNISKNKTYQVRVLSLVGEGDDAISAHNWSAKATSKPVK